MKATDYIPLAVLLAAIGGYIANIVKLIASHEEMGMMIARAIGILVAPLGAILGFF
jgi:hypothetical protein